MAEFEELDHTDSSEAPPLPAHELRAARRWFNDERAPELAVQLALPPRVLGRHYSTRFAFFEDDATFAVVAGPQEGSHVELALAYAVRHADGRRSCLVLPAGSSNATEQRIPWLRSSTRPCVFLHRPGESKPERVTVRRRAATTDLICQRLGGGDPGAELARATAPHHLGTDASGLATLVEELTRDRRLDHGHRRGERSWHYAGQRVLSIKRSNDGTTVTAGIHYTGARAPQPIVIPAGGDLSPDQLLQLHDAVERAVEQRRSGEPSIHRPDEHWLQAVIRRDPSIVGIEQPALREVPAWRPRDSDPEWGRGFVDLMGLDGLGNVRIVETKLASNADDLFVLQGLDYFIWATAYEDALRRRLGAPDAARFELRYVLGADAVTGRVGVSPCTAPLAEALDHDAVPFRFEVVRNWYQPPELRHPDEVPFSEPFEPPFR